MKVYCAECKLFSTGEAYGLGGSTTIVYNCSYAENIKSINSWKSRTSTEFKRLRSPEEINANNDCKWFEQ